MSNFFQLVKNEQNKLYILKSTWAMYIALFILVIVGAFILKAFNDEMAIPEYSENWEQELMAENEQLAEEIETWQNDDSFGWDGMIDYNNSLIAKNNYYVDNRIEPPSYDGWVYLFDNVGLSSFISLFTIIVGAGIVANEFKWGTIKLLLIRPVSRTKILIAKYVSVLLFALTTLAFLMVSSLLVGSLFFGLNGLNPAMVIETSNGLGESTYLLESLKQFGFDSINLVMMATLAFMISTIFRSSSMAIGVAIFLMFSGNIIVNALSNYEWAKYILFANTNLQQYFNGSGPMFEGMSLSFSIIVLIVYYVIFLGLSWLAFTKRDVAGH
ncbi:ABC transporter permease [Alkalihalobacillus sp. 1P02AB]|uniref:ABC transporter permease n=1 Tax=Alkalihalobacillus sp. 1P02AB TaxID=3132260 RepID=UPI0039A5A967